MEIGSLMTLLVLVVLTVAFGYGTYMFIKTASMQGMKTTGNIIRIAVMGVITVFFACETVSSLISLL